MGSRRVLLWEILTFQSPKMRFSAFWGLNLRTKERVFIQGNVGFNLSVTQSIPTSNEKMMKTKLRTFAHKQILHKPITGLLTGRGRKSQFCGIFKDKFAEKSADFAVIPHEFSRQTTPKSNR